MPRRPRGEVGRRVEGEPRCFTLLEWSMWSWLGEETGRLTVMLTASKGMSRAIHTQAYTDARPHHAIQSQAEGFSQCGRLCVVVKGEITVF